jgi:hypothetical protein
MNHNDYSNNSRPNSIQLSHGFETTPSTKEMTKGELMGKSAIAGVLGIIPFLVNQLAMYGFKGLAYVAGSAQKAETGGYLLKQLIAKGVRVLTGVPGMVAAAAMIGSAKIFALSQTLIWGHYVKNPSGDEINTRLAWYGSQPWFFQDLKSIAKAFYSPDKLQKDDWNLLDWSRLKV